jgi:hypothetical protein
MKRPHTAEKLRTWYADPENMRVHMTRMSRPSTREKISSHTKAALADPAVKARQIAGLKAAFADPALREKILTNTKIAMQRWRATRLEAAAVVLRQLPRAERETAMAELASAAHGASKQ